MTHGNDLGYPPAMTKPPKGAAKAATKPKPPAAASTAAKALAAAPQEAHLEALLGQALAAAFPGIDRAKIRHQTTLTVRIGHQEKTLDAKAEWEGSGRADILILHEDRCLAVVEVKRTTVKLALDDAAQAQSYANQFTPRPPLLIVTNGQETITYDSATGERWSAGSDAEKAVAKLLENATAVAAANMKWAVEVLLGPGADIWPEVVRDRTRELIARQTAPAGQGRKPFAQGLNLSRDATQTVLARLRAGVRLLLVDGPPLVGKSNVLRELAETTQTSEEFAVLFMRGGATGLYQSIANILSSALEWEVNPNNVRQWLRRLSRFGRGPTLILAIDGLEPGNAMASDLEELADAGFGEKCGSWRRSTMRAASCSPETTGTGRRSTTREPRPSPWGPSRRTSSSGRKARWRLRRSTSSPAPCTAPTTARLGFCVSFTTASSRRRVMNRRRGSS